MFADTKVSCINLVISYFQIKKKTTSQMDECVFQYKLDSKLICCLIRPHKDLVLIRLENSFTRKTNRKGRSFPVDKMTLFSMVSRVMLVRKDESIIIIAE